MFRLPLLAAAIGFGAVLLSGCGSNVCERSDAVDTTAKKGACDVEVRAEVLGTSCSPGLESCSDADKTVLEETVTCWDDLAVCAPGAEADFALAAAACDAKLVGLSEACKGALFGGVIPGQDAGEDAGEEFDAGPTWDVDGGGALDLVVTTDEDTVAIAWLKRQPGPVALWEVHPFTAADLKETPMAVTPGEKLFFEETIGEGVKKKYFVIGLDDAGTIASGQLAEPDAGAMDAGMNMCNGPLDCAPDMICNLGQCQTLPCTNSNICPGGYLCGGMSMVCERQFGFGDGGTVDAGVEDAGTGTEAKPFVSELVEAQTGSSAVSGDRIVAGFEAANIDVAAVDTARQFMIMEQSNQIFGYFTENRGKSFKTIVIDTIGVEPKVTYEPQSQKLFACYVAAGGVRVRQSTDFGATWPASRGLDIAPTDPMDGGTAESMKDCAIAPWRDGAVLVAAVDGDQVKMWTVSTNLTLANPDPEIVFSSSATQHSPEVPAIATLPEDFIVHVVMSITRVTTQGTTDREAIAMYRDQTTGGAFEGPKNMHVPNTFDQGSPTVTIDPVSKRAIGAIVSRESPTGGLLYDNVYLSLWFPSNKTWVSGTDLDVFEQQMTSKQFIVMPERQASQVWQATAPKVVSSKDGKIYLSFLAGRDAADGQSFVYRAYAVPVSYDACPQSSAVTPFETNNCNPNQRGWYSGPAQRLSDTRVWRAGSSDYAGPAAASDQQISIYWGFVEGVSQTGDVANRPVMVSKPK